MVCFANIQYYISFLLRLPTSVEKVDGGVLFLQSKITEVLGGSGYNTERLGTPYVPQYTGEEPNESATSLKKIQSCNDPKCST